MTRHRKKRLRKKVPKPYSSWFEHDFHKKFPQLEYEDIRFSYVSKHTYLPDFRSVSGYYWFELKGRFRSSAEAKKYLDIRDCLFDGEAEIVFVLYDPNTKMPNAKRRRDGTFATMREWCERHNFKYCTVNTIKKEWING